MIRLKGEPQDAMKAALLDRFLHLGITKVELGRRIGKDEREARRILDPAHPSKIGSMDAAMRAMGFRFVFEFETIEP